MKKIIGIIAFTAILTLPILTLAEGNITGGSGGEIIGGSGENTNPGDTGGSRLPNLLGVDSADGLLNKIVTFLLGIAAIVATIMILIGAYQIMFAQGNSEKWQTGKKTIIYALVGYGIILISKGITLIIKDFLN